MEWATFVNFNLNPYFWKFYLPNTTPIATDYLYLTYKALIFKKGMNKKLLYSFLLLLLLTDLTYSFLQHYSMELDGDMAGGIVPAEDVKTILNDPLGISVITQDAVYPNPNRFFAHWSFYSYFSHAPIALQAFVSPIESVYLSSAIAKTLLQLLIISLLAFLITGKIKVFSLNFLIVALLITPLLQTNGFRSYIGIIDPSPTYTFFYALPCTLLLVFYLPFFYESYYQKVLIKNWFVKTLLIGFTFYVVFSSALNPGIILTISLLYSLNKFTQTSTQLNFKKRLALTFTSIPKNHLLFFSLASFLSLYALYLGSNNAIFIGETIPMAERYASIPKGLLLISTQKIGIPLLFAAIGVNIFLLRKYFMSAETFKLLRFFSWIGAFALVYILLLPLGGYKSYRPHILRYDTIIPITIGLIFMYAASSYYLLKSFTGLRLKLYLIPIFIVVVVFTLADAPNWNQNKCEKAALKTIAQSEEEIVLISNDCTLLSWSKITDPNASDLNAELLKKWNITKNKKLYYQSE